MPTTSSWVVMYQQHYGDRPIFVPVPSNGCLPLERLRHYFPRATGLHYIAKKHLVSVCQSSPLNHRGMLQPSKAVFHLPNSWLVSTFLVTCGDWLSGSSSDQLAIAEQYQGVLECIRGVTEKLRARQLNIDCVQLIIKDLNIFEQMIDNEPERIQEMLKMPSEEVTSNFKTKDEVELAVQVENDYHKVEQTEFSMREFTEVEHSRPKLVKKISSKYFQSLKSSDHYGFSDPDEEIPGDEKDKDGLQRICLNPKSRSTSPSIQLDTCNVRINLVSSRPKLVAKYQHFPGLPESTPITAGQESSQKVFNKLDTHDKEVDDGIIDIE